MALAVTLLPGELNILPGKDGVEERRRKSEAWRSGNNKSFPHQWIMTWSKDTKLTVNARRTNSGVA